jgi:hypothetical protein
VSDFLAILAIVALFAVVGTVQYVYYRAGRVNAERRFLEGEYEVRTTNDGVTVTWWLYRKGKRITGIRKDAKA